MFKKMICNLILIVSITTNTYSQIVIPNNAFTHIAIKSGNWSSKSTWNSGSIPKTGALVRIPNGTKVTYNITNSSEHIFVIKNEGEFNIYANNGANRKLIVDTFYNTPTSKLNLLANLATAGNVDIEIRPFDINRKVNNNNNYGGAAWNNTTLNYFINGENQPVFDHFGKRLPSDGAGVYGRYKWDKNQVSLCLMTMGIVRIKGNDKLDFSELSSNMTVNTNKIYLKKTPTNWKVGDDIVVTGNKLKGRDADEVFKIINISGKQITLNKNAKRDHKGVTIESKTYYPYVANLSRNISIHSTFNNTQSNITKRGHSMFMLNGDIQILNTLFKDLGRTDKSNIVDDLKIGIPTITGTGNARNIEFKNADFSKFDQIRNVENQRGRYAFHFHKSLRGLNSTKLIIAKGNVVWGSPGWGMVHHDSHANFTDNVVYDIEGGGMIAESGSETGVWKDNLVINIRSDQTSPFLPSNEAMPNAIRRTLRVVLDDDFKGGAAYGLQGRAVKMLNNVATTSGVAYHYQGTGENTIVADMLDTSIFQKEGKINPFPLQKKIVRTAVPFIQFKGNRSIGCADGFKSQNRSSGGFHRVLSIVDQLTVINSTRFGIYISTNFGYLIKNSIIHQASEDLTSEASGILIQKDNDNINLNFVKFYNVTTDGVEVDVREGISGNNDAAEFVFNKVKWLKNSGVNGTNDLNHKNPYPDATEKLQVKVTNYKPNSDFVVNFSKSNNMDDEIDYNGSLKLTIRGNVTDKAGTVKFANMAPKAAPRFSRGYNFKDQKQVLNYITTHGGIKNEGTKKYFYFTEYMSNRISGNITPVKIKIYIKNYSTNASKSNNLKTQTDSESELDFTETVLYPNPSSNGYVTFLCKEKSQVEIFNINGKLVQSLIKQTNNTSPTNIEGLSIGIYLVRITSAKNTMIKQLIIK